MADPADRLDVRALARWRRRAAQASTGGDAPWLPGEVARRLQERLSVIRLQPRRWLEASGAVGQGVAALRAVYPRAHGTVIEADASAAEALRRAWRRPWWSMGTPRAPVEVIAEREPWPSGIELVWSNLALSWDTDPPATVARWHAGLEPGGFVMFSTYGPDTLRELRALYQAEGWGPVGADPVDMHDFGDMLVRAGFADPVMDQEVLTLSWDRPDRLVADLRAWGINAAPGRFAGLRTRGWLDRWREAVWAMAGPDGRVRLSIEVAYGHAFKVERAPRAAYTGSISVEALRSTARGRPDRPV